MGQICVALVIYSFEIINPTELVLFPLSSMVSWAIPASVWCQGEEVIEGIFGCAWRRVIWEGRCWLV